MQRHTLVAFAILLPLLASPAARAHEFIVKPGATRADAGAAVPFSVVPWHVFMQGEEQEDAEDISVAVLTGDKRQRLQLTRRDATLTYDGQVAAPTAGTFMLLGAHLPQVWSLTPQGLQRGTPTTLPGARQLVQTSRTEPSITRPPARTPAARPGPSRARGRAR